MITNDATCTREVKFRIAMTKAAFNKKYLFTAVGLTIKEETRVKCYIWSIVLCGAEIWTLRKVDQKYLESSEMWYWRRMEQISWTDRVKDDMQHRCEEERNVRLAM